MLEEFHRVAESVAYSAPRIGVVSNVTGKLAGDELAAPEYWVRHVREAVRFADGVAALEGAGVRRFLELGPDGVLCGMVDGCLSEQAREGVLLAPAMRAGWEEARGAVEFLARIDSDGMNIDWPALFTGQPRQRVKLPRYAFQRERYWLSRPVGVGDASGIGMGASDHPLLGAAVQMAGGEGWLFTGRLSLDTHAWLAGHAVLDTVLLPGTGFLELVLAAGRAVGCVGVEELTLQAPLVLVPGGAVQLQVAVGGPGEDGAREVVVYSRPRAGVGEEQVEGGAGGWTRHASGVLVADTGAAGESRWGPAGVAAGSVLGLGSQWPPAGARELDVEFLYDRLAEAGFGYGPAFQGVQAAWRTDSEVYAEVALDHDTATEAAGYGIHPALLDAALHTGLMEWGKELSSGGQVVLFSLGGVSLHRDGVSSLRVVLTRDESDTVSLVAFDEAGELVLSISSLGFRPVEVGQLRGAQDRGGSLFRNTWVELPVPVVAAGPPRLAILGDLDALVLPPEGERYADLAGLVQAIIDGAPAPEAVIASAVAESDGGDLALAARMGVQQTLLLLQEWLSAEVLVDTRLVLVTSGAVAVREGEVPDLGCASVWGLLRSAQSEHPGRFLVVDVDPGSAPVSIPGELDRDGNAEGVGWSELLAIDEPQVALRDGRVKVPRLEPIRTTAPAAPVLDADGTVLITGGTGTLGALVARHLAGEHGARRLLLASRRGMQSEGADDLLVELAELGCQATIVACDVCERDQIQKLIDSVAPEHPLTAVVHAAGALHDGTIESLTAAQVEEVMRPKVDAALHLHQLTADLGLAEFVLFSSAAGVLGSAGQGNYAAANACLDALAQVRRARGQAGVSLAWGLWEQLSGLTGGPWRGRQGEDRPPGDRGALFRAGPRTVRQWQGCR